MREPPLARALLSAVVDPADRPFLLDDLREEYLRIAAARGPAAARRWYRRQALGSLLPSLSRRLRRLIPERHPMHGFVQDLRIAARGYLKRPGFALLAVGTLALAIGANTAMFSVANGVLLKPMPGMSDTEGLVEISRDLDGQFYDMSYPVVQALARDAETLEGVAAMALSPVAVGGEEAPAMEMGLQVTASYFDLIRLTPSRGRFFTADEATFPRTRPVVVVSHHLWRERGAPDLSGATLTVNGVPLDVVGVGPVGFRGHAAVPVDVYTPMGAAIPGLRSPDELSRAQSGVVEVLGRLRPGVSGSAARAEVTAVGAAVRMAETGGEAGRYQARVEPWGRIPAVGRGPVTLFLGALLVVAGLVLAVACINVGGMMLARASERGDEVALRRAVGAGRGRIVRQLLTEGLLMALVAGGLGVLVAGWAADLLLTLEPPLPAGFDLALDFGLDGKVLAYSLGITLAAALLFNLAPALHATRDDVADSLKSRRGSGRPGRTRARKLLVGGQMALSLVLLAMAGLFLRALSSMRGSDPGWDVTDVYSLEVDLEQAGVSDAEGQAFWREVTARLAEAPGVRSAAVASKLPLSGASSFGDAHVEGVAPPQGRSGHEALVNRVSPGYFETLGITRLRGRDFEATDGPESPKVAVVSETMARRLWPEGDAVGRTFDLGATDPITLTVVGVVEDSDYQRLDEPPGNVYFVPVTQWYDASMALLVKAEPALSPQVVERMGQVVAELQPGLPPLPPRPLSDRLAFGLLPQRVAAWVTGIMGLLGLGLGAVGVYGVTAFATEQRTREIGIRLALGARRGDVLAMMVREGMVAPLAGMVAGVVTGLVMATAVGRFLGDVGPADPWAFGAASLTLLAVAAAATAAPAVRAVRRDPVPSLRSE